MEETRSGTGTPERPGRLDAATLAMSLLIGAEVVLFACLAIIYVIFRIGDPELFAYGHGALDWGWGAVGAVALLLGTVTLGMAAWCARSGQRRMLRFLLLVTLICGVDFLIVQSVEYGDKIRRKLVFSAEPHQPGTALDYLAKIAPPEEGPTGPSLERGREIWNAACRTCHGARGEGVKDQGADMRKSEFIQDKTDPELVGFLQIGRAAKDPLNTTGLLMPERGGNPLLTDDDLQSAVLYVRTLVGAAATADGDVPEEFWIPKSSIPPAARGPCAYIGPLSRWGAVLQPAMDPARPANSHVFFGLYLCMTGFLSLHVLIGIAVVGWLLWRTRRASECGDCFGPVRLTGMFWRLVCVIWILMLPLLYWV